MNINDIIIKEILEGMGYSMVVEYFISMCKVLVLILVFLFKEKESINFGFFL